MKIGRVFVGVLVLLGIIANILLFKIKWFQFTGLMLGMILFLSVAGNFIYKYIQKKKGVKTDSFLLPDSLSEKAKNMDMGIQYESSVVAISFLIIGIIAFDIYIFFFYPMNAWFKFFALFNSLCGLALMISMLVTNYQQLMSYRQSTSFINSYAQSKKNKIDYDDSPQQYVTEDDLPQEEYPEPPRRKIRPRPTQSIERGYY